MATRSWQGGGGGYGRGMCPVLHKLQKPRIICRFKHFPNKFSCHIDVEVCIPGDIL